MKNYLQLLLISLCVILISASCKQQKADPRLILFSEGFDQPCCIAHANDSRLFIVGQKGFIYALDSAGKQQEKTFLDIHERVVYGGERGLLGLAFHPSFSQNGYLFVNYTGVGDSTIISRFSLMKDDPTLADPESEFRIMAIAQPYPNHNGGCLTFGPDGYLYIGMGDGGASGDPENRSQNPSVLLGKMLRIDINAVSPYGIPADNPFITDSTYRPEIWATGLRNPWRYSFDRLTGDLWIADVGQNKIEEVNFQAANSKGGENYGWRCYEGNDTYNRENCDPDLPVVFPIHTYTHGEECSVTGGNVFRGDESSPYYGAYFFADYCSDKIWTIRKENESWKAEDFGTFKNNNFSTFGEDKSGNIYVAGLSSGKIYRLNTKEVIKD